MDFDHLASYKTVDLTTIGVQSGLPRTVEIWWFRFEERFIITGTPGKRDWLANIKANGQVTIHVAGDSHHGRATEVNDRAFRHRFFSDPNTRWYSTQSELEKLVRVAPMVEIHLESPPDP